MPKKSKKKTKKKKSKVKKDPIDDEDKCPIDIPEYQDPEIYTPRANLRIVLSTPYTKLLNFNVKVMITARVEEIRRMIIDNHDGSVKDLIICLGAYDKESHLDPKKTL